MLIRSVVEVLSDALYDAERLIIAQVCLALSKLEGVPRSLKRP